MRRAITLFTILFVGTMGFSQQDGAGASAKSIAADIQLPEALNELYAQAKQLETNGTATEINQNRLAIKAAWEQIDPNVASLYVPINTEGLYPDTEENLHINGVYIPDEIKQRDGIPAQTRDWDVDRLLMEEWVDGGVDMEVTLDGEIYISSYQNNIENEGATFDEIIIHRSLDGGSSWEEWQRVNVTAPMRKMELISIDGSLGDEFLVAYLITTSENFQAWRWNTANGNFEAEVIDSGVSDFSVDRNYPTNTDNQRVFATYLKQTTCTEVFSARSTAGDYGFNWVDAVSIDIVCGQQVDFTYGLNGGCYTVYTGAGSGNLYVNTNNNYNDPASWTARETLVAGATSESLNPTICATRKEMPSDEVLVLTSSRNAGSADGYTGLSYIRENAAAFNSGTYISTTQGTYSIAHIDAWVRKVNSNEIIQTAYVRDRLDNTEDDVNRARAYNGTDFDAFEAVGDTGVDVWDGFPSAVAETNDGMPCLAFAGTSSGGGYGFGLYFDAKSEIVFGVEDNTIEGLTFAPNPVNDVLNISAKASIAHISVFNLLGAEVLSVQPGATKTQLEMAGLSAGIYLVKAATENATETFKVIKN